MPPDPDLSGGSDDLNQPWILAGDLVAKICINMGFRGEALVTAIAVARAESGFDAHVVNVASADSKWVGAVGLFQIRCLRHPEQYGGMDRQRVSTNMKYPARNAKFAYELSRGGRDWSSWSAYTNKSYRKFLTKAREWANNPEEGANPAGAPSVSPVESDWIDEDRNPLPINIGADAHPGELGNRVVSAVVEYSMAEASLSRFELEDEDASLLRKQKITEGVALSVASRRQIITSVGAKQGPGSPHMLIESQPAGVVRLRGVTPAARTTTAVKYARSLAKAAGLEFEGGPASPKVSIRPERVDLGGTATSQVLDPTIGMAHGTRKENAWEVLRRLARESTGYVCFESGGTLYFATQDWLIDNTGIVYVQVGNAKFNTPRAGTAIRAVGFPDIDRAIKRDSRNRVYRHVDVAVDLPPGPGYNALPGKRLWMAEPTGIVDDARAMLITRCTIQGGDRSALVRIQASSYTAPGDADSQPTSVPATGAGTAGSHKSQNGWPASPNPGKIGVTTWHVPGSSVSLPLANPAAKVLLYVAAQFDNRVESLRSGTCWGYSYRAIRGSSTLSNHSSGTAIDLNAPQHPLGAQGTFSRSQVAEIHQILDECKGLIRWGGNYNGRKDEMHFEIDADPATVKRRFG